jgi:nucleotidyltransferase/DNA polymerase involved in DNA repair
MNKPNGQFKLDNNAAEIQAFLQDLPIRKCPGIGKVNEQILTAIGILKVGDLVCLVILSQI